MKKKKIRSEVRETTVRLRMNVEEIKQLKKVCKHLEKTYSETIRLLIAKQSEVLKLQREIEFK